MRARLGFAARRMVEVSDAASGSGADRGERRHWSTARLGEIGFGDGFNLDRPRTTRQERALGKWFMSVV